MAETRASSYPIRRQFGFELDENESRFRADSFPEPRHLRRLRRELDLDSDLDRKSRYSRPEDAFLQTPEAKLWKANKLLQKGFKYIEESEVVVVSREAMAPPSPSRDVMSSETALTHIPYTNWTHWNYAKGLSHNTGQHSLYTLVTIIRISGRGGGGSDVYKRGFVLLILSHFS